MKWVLIILFFVCFISFVSAAEISEDLHLNIQTTDSDGDIVTGTFAFAFNISNNSDCAVANVVYTNLTSLTTDSRGIISYYLNNVSLNYSDQYWLCYYRDGVLINNSKIARTPYSFRARNITIGGVEVDANFDLGIYNVTASWFKGIFNWVIGTGSDYLSFNGTTLNFNDTKLNATIGAIGNNTYLKKTGDTATGNYTFDTSTLFVDSSSDRVGIGTTSPQDMLHIEGTQPELRFVDTDVATKIWHIGVVTGDFKITETDVANRMTIQNATGNVGIGAGNPNNKLHILGGSGTIVSVQASSLDTGALTGIQFKTTTDTGDQYYRAGILAERRSDGYIDLHLATRDTVAGNINVSNARLTIIKTGNVGIGVTSPNSKLEVNGTFNASSSGGSLRVDSIGDVKIGI